MDQAGPSQTRMWAHIRLHMQAPGFELVPRLIGTGGCNMRRIFAATGAKIRIRGRGSGHLEGKRMQEANIPLMVAVTAGREDVASFVQAVEMMLQELRSLEEPFQSHCRDHRLRFGGPRFSVQGPTKDLLAEVLGEGP